MVLYRNKYLFYWQENFKAQYMECHIPQDNGVNT